MKNIRFCFVVGGLCLIVNQILPGADACGTGGGGGGITNGGGGGGGAIVICDKDAFGDKAAVNGNPFAPDSPEIF